jgi:hypothetical protein
MITTPVYYPEEIRAIVNRAAAYRHQGMWETGEPPREYPMLDHEYELLVVWYAQQGLIDVVSPELRLYGMTCVREVSRQMSYEAYLYDVDGHFVQRITLLYRGNTVRVPVVRELPPMVDAAEEAGVPSCPESSCRTFQLVADMTPRLVYAELNQPTQQYDSEDTALEEWEQAVNATIQDAKARRGLRS